MHAAQDQSSNTNIDTHWLTSEPSVFNIPIHTQHTVFERIIPVKGNPSRLMMYEENIKSLPQPPALWQVFQKACDQEASSKKLGNIIKDDPVLASIILRIANAPGLGVRIAITDIRRAIAYLGTSLTRNIVTRHAFSGDMPTSSSKVYQIQKLWKHGIAVSTFAEIVAEYIPNCSPENASTLGLFHDIGKISMNLITQYRQPAKLDYQQGHLMYEFKQFSCTHIDLGVLLAKHWNLPKSIIQGIAYHHHPAYTEAQAIPDNIRTEVFAVYLADLIAIYLGFATCNTGIVLPHDSFAAMLPNITLQDLIQNEKIQAEIERIHHVEF